VEDEFLEPTRRQRSGQGADSVTDEELDRFALVLKECERIRALIAREEAAFSNGEHDDGMPIVAAPPVQWRPGSRGPPTPELTMPGPIDRTCENQPEGDSADDGTA